MAAKHTLMLSSRADAHSVRDALSFCRMLAREAAAIEQNDATRAALSAIVSALSVEMLDLDDALEEDGLIRQAERENQGRLPFAGALA